MDRTEPTNAQYHENADRQDDMQSLSEFPKTLLCDMKEFLEWWVERHAENKQLFPIEMPKEDWMDNFSIWVATKKDDVVQDPDQEF